MGQWTDEAVVATAFPDLDSNQVADLVADAEAEVIRYLRREVLVSDAIEGERVWGDGGRMLILRERPIVSVEAITLDGVEVDLDQIVIDMAAGLVERTCGVWGAVAYEVDYTAGYAADAIPRWLTRATMLVMERLASSGGGARDVKSYRLRDYQVEFRPEAEDGGSIPSEAMRLLDPQRNPVFD